MGNQIDNQLTVRGLNVFYGRAHVLQNVDLTVKGQPVAIVGRNGMGKTTLCQAIMGLLSAQSGEILLNQQVLHGRPPFQVARQGIGYVPQGRRVFPSLTVHEHLQMIPTQQSNKNQSQSTKGQWSIDKVYAHFPRLAERRNHGGAQLSGGEQQMLAIGRTLLTNPCFLLMDEPSEGLAPVIVDQMVALLHTIVSEGVGLLIVEQKLAVACALAERVLIMVNGQIALETSAATLLADNDLQRRFLGVGATIH